MRRTVLALLAALGAALGVEEAHAQGVDVLSIAEMTLADCVGQALAVEHALMDQPGLDVDQQAATSRADALLHVALTRYVGVGRVDTFHRRAALAFAAESLRMRTAIEIAGNAGRVIERTERDLERDCGAFLE